MHAPSCPSHPTAALGPFRVYLKVYKSIQRRLSKTCLGGYHVPFKVLTQDPAGAVLCLKLVLAGGQRGPGCPHGVDVHSWPSTMDDPQDLQTSFYVLMVLVKIPCGLHD